MRKKVREKKYIEGRIPKFVENIVIALVKILPRPALRGAARIVMYFLYHPKVIGIENIPKKGRIIIASNHVHLLDPAFLVYVRKFLGRNVTYIAKKELFDDRVLRPILKKFHVISVDQQNPGKETFKQSFKVLARRRSKNNALGIFPEGTRNPEGKELPILDGIGFLAIKGESAVVPMRTFGNYRYKDDPETGEKKERLYYLIGKPFTIDKSEKKGSGQ
jgi:1-acyl-sn-glycerol-3-phosphate acyltransferase